LPFLSDVDDSRRICSAGVGLRPLRSLLAKTEYSDALNRHVVKLGGASEDKTWSVPRLVGVPARRTAAIPHSPPSSFFRLEPQHRPEISKRFPRMPKITHCLSHTSLET
jgi:hypothetical protein